MTAARSDLNSGYLGVDVTPFTELTSMQRQFLAHANLGDLAPTEAWTVAGTNMQMGYSTHGVFRYFGKFPPPIATRLIALYSESGDLVLDPMCGSGTTGVEAARANRRCQLSDVNPLSVLLSKVKTNHLPVADTTEAISRVVGATARNRTAIFRPVGLRNLDHWFMPETIESLARIREAIDEEPEGKIKDLLKVSLASVVRRVSRATTQQGRLFLDINTAIPDAVPVFEIAANKIASAVANFHSSQEISVYQRNLMDPEDGPPHNAPLSIIHPPYFNMYKYSSVNSLEMAWLGMDAKSVRKDEVREFFKIGKPENAGKYITDMRLALENGCRQVEAGGVAAIMIGDTTIGGNHIQVIRPLIETLPKSIHLEKVIVRVPRFTEATWAASQRRKGNELGVRLYDIILILRKQA